MSSDAAAALVAARRAKRRLPGLAIAPGDVAAAYRVQAEAQELLFAAAGHRLAGYKIGCTTAVMQAFLGISSPCAGMMGSGDLLASPAALPHAGFLRPGVECEIAMRLDRPLRPGDAPFTQVSVAPAVGACMAAIEIVDDRWEDYRSVGTAGLIADDFFHAGCVLGPAAEDWQQLDLAAVRGTTVIDGVEAGSGVGGDVMGHPLAALAWLANSLAARGIGLEAGAVVMTGSVVETKWVAPGAHVAVELTGLGTAAVSFTV